ncbi:pyridoxal-phosphate dependent enzyme [Mesorhizobium sp. INR15]|nr:pyridoxal-phosphate dependent enzyme [Mesorhizobium sp. INR15]
MDEFARFSLLEGPTPIQRLHRLEQEIGEVLKGVRLFVKRDDLMGLGGGGNKLRKLEFLMGDALAQRCDTFITTGGIQSNHGRLSAAAAARAGLSCELVLTRVVPRDDEEYRRNGNILLDGILGAKVHELPATANALTFAKERATALKAEGRRSYVVGLGGSSPVGCLGYAICAREVAEQEKAVPGGFARIVIPNGSAGTHAGLAAGFAALRMDPAKVRSFTISAEAEDARRTTLDLARATLTDG